MGKSSGSIWVSLGLRTSEFTKGIKRSRKELSGFQKFGAGLKGMFNPLTVGLGAIASVGVAFNDAVERIKAFDKSMKTLSAITGATGKDLDFLKDKAIEMGSKTTLSAGQVADGFKLIASAKPELLKSGEALAVVTESAITLAEAAGITMEEASGALANTLNQFGASAAEAAKFVDVLAAGSQQGAGDVNFLNEAFVKAGVVASQAGLSVTETAASFEVLAEKGFKAEAAGTQFRNILVELQSGADDTNPAVVGLAKAIENLGDKNLTTAELAKKFGKQNLAAAQTLLAEQDRLEELTLALDENGIALKQQATNNDTLEGSLKSLDSAWEGFILSVEDGEGIFGQAFKTIADGLTNIISGVTDLINFDFERPAQGMDAYLQALTGVNFGLDATGEKLRVLEGALKNVSADDLTAKSGELAKQFVNAGLSAEDAAKKVFDLVSVRRQLEGSTDELVVAEKESTEETKVWTKEQQKAATAARETQKSIDDFAASLLATDYSEMGTGEDIFAGTDDILDKLTQDFQAEAPALELPIKVLAPTEAEVAAAAAAAEKIAMTQQAIASATDEAFSSMANSVVASMGEAESGVERFQQAMVGIVLKLIGQALGAALANAITGATGAAAVAGPFAPAVLPATIASMTGATLAAFAAIPAFAEGTTNFGGGTALVGELGPELVNLPRGSDVIPNDKLGGMMGGASLPPVITLKAEGGALVATLKRQGKTAKYSQ